MNVLWAPWRMQFIMAPKPAGCIFCEFPARTQPGADRENLLLGRTKDSFVLFNRYPYNSGHLMVVPRRHTADFAGLSAAESADLHGLLQLSTRLLRERLRPDGFNIGMNLGQPAGAGIVDHLHYHLIPRWSGDTNFMPLVADTKVIIEHLETAFDQLRPVFDQALAR